MQGSKSASFEKKGRGSNKFNKSFDMRDDEFRGGKSKGKNKHRNRERESMPEFSVAY